MSRRTGAEEALGLKGSATDAGGKTVKPGDRVSLEATVQRIHLSGMMQLRVEGDQGQAAIIVHSANCRKIEDAQA